MRSINRSGRGRPRAAWLVLPALVLMMMVAGRGALTATAAQVGTVTVQKGLVDANNAVAAGDLSGYVFTLTGTGGTVNLPATNALGQTAIGVAPGNYAITEQQRAGSTLVGFTIGGAPVASFSVVAGQTVAVNATNRVVGTNSITITKQIVDTAGTVQTTADRSGFQFTIAGPAGFTGTVTTDANGGATLTNLASGTYTVTESSRTGFTFVSSTINGASVANGAQFVLGAPGPTSASIVVQNRAGATTSTVSITKQIVDASGAIQSTADRAGFSFTLACGAQSVNVTTDAAGAGTFTSVPAGSCTISETARTGFTLVSIVPAGGTNIVTSGGTGGTIAPTAGQTLALTVQNRAGAAQGTTESVPLATGCNNISLTFPSGTATTTVAAAITPPGNLISIFRFDSSQNRFLGFSPLPGAPNDLVTVNRLDAVFICMSAPGTLARPTI